MSNEANNTKKKFNPTLARGYTMKRGYWSPVITSEEYDEIMRHVEVGGRLVLKINQNKKSDKSPDAYFEFISAEDNKVLTEIRNSKPEDEI